MSEVKTTVAEQAQEDSLQLFTLGEVEKSLPSVVSPESNVSPELEKQASDLLERLLNIDPKDLRAQQDNARAMQNLGDKVATQLSRKSELLKEPMHKLMDSSKDGSDVASSLQDLQETVSDINPNRVNFDMGTVRRLLAMIPGVGTPLSRWFARFQTVESVIDDIVKSLKDGRGQLERDNVTLIDDQIEMRELTLKLNDYIVFGQLMDQKLTATLEDVSLDEDRKRFLQEEVHFPLRQRIIDLQQVLAVNQQGVLTTEMIVRNNKELIRGVDRSLNVTITGLQVATTLAVALEHQKRVLKGVEAVNKTTDDLLLSTSEKLKTQGVEIQKQASQAALDIDKMKTAFQNILTAINDVSEYRRQALPQMADSILKMDSLTQDMEKTITKMEKGGEVKKTLSIEL